MSEFLNPNDEKSIKAALENAAAENAAAEKAAAEKAAAEQAATEKAAAEKAAAEKAAAEQAAAEQAAAEQAAESVIEAEVELRSGSRGQALPAKPVHEQPDVVPTTASHPQKQRDAALLAERHYGAGLEASKRGETARALGYFEQALNALEQAHEPERPTYLLSAGNMHLKMGEPAKALNLYEKCQLACQLRPMTSTQTAILEEKMRLARDAMAAAKWAKEKRAALGSLAQGAGAELGTLAESTLKSLTPLWRQVLGVADLFKEPKPLRYNMLRDSPADAKYKVCIVQFKVPGAKNGGSDKGFDGDRIDSIPIANGVIQAGGACDLVRFDSDKNKYDTREFELLTANYDALIVRINQGQLSQGTPGGTQKRFDALMSKYVAKGKLVLGHENQPLPPLRSEFTVGEFICSSRLAQLTTNKFQAVCGGDKTLADVPDEDYYEASVLTDLMGVKVIEMLEARLPCLNTQTSMASNGPDAEVSLLSTQERGVREVKIGSACASAAVPSAQPNSLRARTLSEAASLAYLQGIPPPALMHAVRRCTDAGLGGTLERGDVNVMGNLGLNIVRFENQEYDVAVGVHAGTCGALECSRRHTCTRPLKCVTTLLLRISLAMLRHYCVYDRIWSRQIPASRSRTARSVSICLGWEARQRRTSKDLWFRGVLAPRSSSSMPNRSPSRKIRSALALSQMR
jgi:chemotaxis protein histidine kinase CheA